MVSAWPSLVIVPIWGTYQQIEDFSLCVSLLRDL